MTITAAEEQALVTAHQAGDAQAFTEIITAYRAGLLAHARRRLRDPEAAHDALQETLLRAYRGIDRFGGDQLLGAWLYRILDNVCNDEASRRQRELRLLQRVGLPMVQHIDSPHTLDSSVWSALDALPSTYREALVLRAIEDLTFRDVAERTGTSEENARARFHRARNLFRRMLDGSAAVLLPVVAFLARPFRRFRFGPIATGPAPLAQQPVVSSPVSTLVSSPTATHFITEIAVAPERAGSAAKLLVALAAAVPMAAAVAPSATPLRPPSVQQPAVVATAAADSSGSDDSTPTSVSLALPTVTTLLAGEANASGSGSSSTSTTPAAPKTIAGSPVRPVDTGAAALDAPADPPAPIDGEPLPVSPLPAGATLVATVPINEDRDAFHIAGEVEMQVGENTISGSLYCNFRPQGVTAAFVFCSWTSADGSLAVAVGGMFDGNSDAAPQGRFNGSYDVVSAGSSPDLGLTGAVVGSVRAGRNGRAAHLLLSFWPSQQPQAPSPSLG